VEAEKAACVQRKEGVWEMEGEGGLKGEGVT
jgi:hypothetical protein